MSHEGFAVLDFETTGISPEYHHRVIELAVVHVAPDGAIEDRFETLVHPDRDLGPTHIHGLRGSDMREAPRFSGIAPEFLDRLRGRVLVAHNASFEARFLRAELARLGVDSPVGNGDALCTMRLATLFLPGGGRSLADCCAAYDIPLHDAHRAVNDTVATAKLLAAYREENPRADVWARHRELAAGQDWPTLPSTGTRWVSRGSAPEQERSFLERTVQSLPGGITDQGTAIDEGRGSHRTQTPEEQEYFALLDRVLADGFVTLLEAEELVTLAGDLGLRETDRARLHDDYFEDVVIAAHRDGILDADEIQQIRTVGTLLNIDPREIEAALIIEPAPPVEKQETTGGVRPISGDMVVFTGDMPHPRSYYEEIARARGLEPRAGVTKKVRWVVAEDVDSFSGKALKARNYGIPILSASRFLELLN
ncbi:exonuclease domain-containing protein [Mycetocola spongiae]|uniref:exonuclease domain-containing protein n=1 Tax=Mycetocola spongiae TaxID=2859226 RepID=UPI0021F43A01|nr:exonuclease domain-containing protein [Mycetocola spongiae]UCR89685.1 DNA polymerase III subunit epsilon [Mycetocola spongiae]